MLFLFRSAPEVEKRIHSKLFRKFWRSRGTKEPAYITVKRECLILDQGELNKAINPQMQNEAAFSFVLLWPDFLDASLDFACWCLQKSASWKDLSFFFLKYWVFLLCWCFISVNQDVQFIQKLTNVDIRNVKWRSVYLVITLVPKLVFSAVF